MCRRLTEGTYMRKARIATFPAILAWTSALTVALALLTPAARAQEGEAAFRARCGACHGPRDIKRWGRQRRDAAARQAWLDQFLRRHYPPPEAERASIIAHIESVIGAGATRQ
jgi:hypothetical protein